MRINTEAPCHSDLRSSLCDSFHVVLAVHFILVLMQVLWILPPSSPSKAGHAGRDNGGPAVLLFRPPADGSVTRDRGGDEKLVVLMCGNETRRGGLNVPSPPPLSLSLDSDRLPLASSGTGKGGMRQGQPASGTSGSRCLACPSRFCYTGNSGQVSPLVQPPTEQKTLT